MTDLCALGCCVSMCHLQAKVARFRAAYDVRNKIKVLVGADGGEEQLMGLPAEVVAAVRQYRNLVSLAWVNQCTV